MPITAKRRWHNWLGNQRACARYREPESLAELAKCVREAEPPIRALGAGASWSALVPTSGTLISLRKLDRVISIDGASDPPTARVECGMPLGKLVRVTDDHGLTLRSRTIYKDLSVGGLVGVGAHGGARGYGTMSDDVLALTLVTPDGEVRRLTETDGDVFQAARLGLGALGVIHDVTLRCERDHRVRVENLYLPAEEVFDPRNLEDLRKSYEFIELYWFLVNDMIWAKLGNRTDAPVEQGRLAPLTRRFSEDVKLAGLGTIFPVVSRYFPALTPALIELSLRTLERPVTSAVSSAATAARRPAPPLTERAGRSIVETLRASDAFHYTSAYPKCWDAEYAIPVEETVRAWRETRDLILAYAAEGRYPVNLCVHLRFTGPSKGALLSPSYGAPGSSYCYIEAPTTPDARDHAEFYRRFDEQMLNIDTARPHWGKHFVPFDGRVPGRYPEFARFEKVRRALDPEGRFLNPHLRAVFGAPSPPA